MDYIQLILLLIIVLGSAIWLSNSIPAIITCKQDKTQKGFFNKWVLLISGICCFLAIMFVFLMAIQNFQEKDNKIKPTFTPINEQLYRKSN